MKKNILLLFLILIIGGIIGCSISESDKTDGGSKESYELIMTHELPESFFKHEYMEQFKDLVEERTDGRVAVEIHSSGQLFNDAEAVEALGTGAVHMTWPVSVHLENLNEEYGITSLPFTLKDEDILNNDEYRKEYTNLLDSIVEDNGIKILGVMRTAEGIFLTKDKEIKHLDDFKGLKIRSVGGHVSTDLMESLNATSVGLPATEIATSLSQGVIDGVNTSPDGWTDVVGTTAKYGFIVPEMQAITYSIAADQAWFDDLPGDIQDIIKKTIDELILSQWQESIDLDAKYLETAKEDGGNVYVLPDNEIDEFKKATKPVIESFENEYPDVMEELNEINNKYK